MYNAIAERAEVYEGREAEYCLKTIEETLEVLAKVAHTLEAHKILITSGVVPTWESCEKYESLKRRVEALHRSADGRSHHLPSFLIKQPEEDIWKR